MKKLAILFITVSCFSFAQEMTPEEMKAWQEYMTPSEVHQMMAKDVGVWEATTTMWFSPDSEPLVSKGTSVVEMLLDGRYLQSTFHGDFMGQPMKGMSTMAYDNATKEFTSIWIDNFGTGMMVLKGKLNKEKNQAVLEGNMVDPISGKPVPTKEVYTWVDDNNQKMELYQTIEGMGSFQTMEILFKRMESYEAEGAVMEGSTVEEEVEIMVSDAESAIGVPQFQNAEVQKIVDGYDSYLQDLMKASRSGNAARAQELSTQASQWSDKLSEIVGKMTQDEVQKFQEWAMQLAEQASGDY